MSVKQPLKRRALATGAIDIERIEEGLDRILLTRLKRRFLDLNQRRHQRTCAAVTERQSEFLQLLPLLFHLNHPMLPGYVSHRTPSGLPGYQPDKPTLHLAKKLARSFHYRADVRERKAAIDAVFLMGSVGTLAHSEHSDFDVWVCHSDGLTGRELADLQLKCRQLSLWAQQTLRLEIHFFPMNDGQFRRGRIETLSSEGSGSAQNFLLLDEFYRTAVWLGGKLPLWWFVPASQEHRYDEFADILVGRRFLRAAEVVDFGGVPQIPPQEFLGAGIWQLYKAIGSPYKSLLKLLLLEAYASDREARPLSVAFKHAVYQGQPDADQLDPYILVYRRLEAYLLWRGQTQRLELARRSFYFKVDKPLTHRPRSGKKSWQRRLLEGLVAEWGWPSHQLHLLDSRQQWRAPQVLTERSLLVRELSNSYRLLTDMAKTTHAQASIREEELTLLGRKLHAAFERKAGKIEWINPGISSNLEEPALSFQHYQSEGTDQWQVYRGTLAELSRKPRLPEPLKRARGFLELLLWCQCNGLIEAGTQIDIDSPSVALSEDQMRRLLEQLRHWLPEPGAAGEHEHFQQLALPRRVMLLVNLGVEPLGELQQQGLQLLSARTDALGYSGLKENLVLSLDLVVCNSWGEVVCRHFGQDALVASLLHYLRLAPPGGRAPAPEMSIHCFNRDQGRLIERRINELWADLVACFQRDPNGARYVLETAEEYLLLQMLQGQPRVFRYAGLDGLMAKLAEPQSLPSRLHIDRHALSGHPLRLIGEAGERAGPTVFFQAREEAAELYLLDEKGSLFAWRQSCLNSQTLLRSLHRFLCSVIERQSLDAGEPLAAEDLACFEITDRPAALVGRADGARPLQLEPHRVSGELNQQQLVAVQVIAEPDGDGRIGYTVYCDEREFSGLSEGEALFETVAAYILGQRRDGERYPCYITDLDLSQCREIIAPQSGLQLTHYLQIKTELESRLTKALQRRA